MGQIKKNFSVVCRRCESIRKKLSCGVAVPFVCIKKNSLAATPQERILILKIKNVFSRPNRRKPLRLFLLLREQPQRLNHGNSQRLYRQESAYR